jgi:hypothetical protein
LCGHFAAKRTRVDVVHEGPLTVDLDHGQPLPVPRLQLRIPSDVDLFEVEGDLGACVLDDRASTLAEVAPLRVVQPDAPYG